MLHQQVKELNGELKRAKDDRDVEHRRCREAVDAEQAAQKKIGQLEAEVHDRDMTIMELNYYEIYDRYNGELLTRGNAAECRKALGCASLDSFYALANRARRGINKKYRVVIKKGGQVDYPVLGKDDPLYQKEG